MEYHDRHLNFIQEETNPRGPRPCPGSSFLLDAHYKRTAAIK